MLYGYCRTSTARQNIERQVRNISAMYPQAVIIKEVYTGTKIVGRKEFDKLIKIVKSGDTIVFDSVSRMSRTAQEGFRLYKDLLCRDVNLVFLKEPHINTDTYRQAIEKKISVVMNSGDNATDELMQAIIAALNNYILTLAEKQIILAFEQAEKEVEDLHQRTREGMETARLNGKQIGLRQGTKLTTKKSVEAKEKIQKFSKDFNGYLNDGDCIKLIGIARGTYYKYKRELTECLYKRKND